MRLENVFCVLDVDSGGRSFHFVDAASMNERSARVSWTF